MYIIEMLIAIVIVIIGDHFIGFTFETHTFSTAAAGYSIASIGPFNRHFALIVWASADIILFHILLKCCTTTLLCLLTGHFRMVIQFTL